MTPCSVRRHVHAVAGEWTLTSDVPVSELLACAVLTAPLPGRFGARLLPADAAAHREGARADPVALRESLATERAIAPRAHRGLVHVSVDGDAAPEAVESDTDGYSDDGDDSDDECADPPVVEDDGVDEDDDDSGCRPEKSVSGF